MPEGKPKWVQFKKWSGIIVRGSELVEKPVPPGMHMDRAVWLTSRLEGAAWGTVQSYDGAGMSAGMLHNIAVQPASGEQGSLFQLLLRVFSHLDAIAPVVAQPLKTALADQGWYVAQDGVLRSSRTGGRIAGVLIRDVFAPPLGVVPKSGLQYREAVQWALLFHRLFAHKQSRKPQLDYAIKWLAGGQSKLELSVYRDATDDPALDSPIGLDFSSMDPRVELAMCVYHSFSVNGPSPAARCLTQVFKKWKPSRDPEPFAKALVRRLGAYPYGRWRDQPGDGANRYDRTRRVIWSAPELFDSHLANVLMPRDL